MDDRRGIEPIDDDDRRRCTARSTRTGERCKKPPMKEQRVCLAHGGGAPRSRAKARERQVERQAAAELARLDVTPLDDPLSELALLAAQVVAWKDMMAGRVNELTSLRYEGEGSGEQLRAEVALWERALDRCERVLVAMARLNIDERLTAIAEAQAEVIISVFAAALDRAGVAGAQAQLALTAADEEFARQAGIETAPAGPQKSAVCRMRMHESCRAPEPAHGGSEPPPWCSCECHRPAV